MGGSEQSNDLMIEKIKFNLLSFKRCILKNINEKIKSEHIFYYRCEYSVKI